MSVPTSVAENDFSLDMRATLAVTDKNAIAFIAVLNQTAATQASADASLAFVKEHGVGRARLSGEVHAVAARSTSGVYAPAEKIAAQLNLPLFEVYGRLIRSLLDEARDDGAQQAQVREIMNRYFGEAAKTLAGAADANYQYLDLVDISELDENAAYALAVLSLMRPRGDRVQLYVTGNKESVAARIASVMKSYAVILAKLGSASRANVAMLNVSGWTPSDIQKSMLNFATGKNGRLEAALLSARAEFLNDMNALPHIQRMNRRQINRSQALLASPALLAAQSLNERTYDVLQMRDELQRLGLGALLSVRFAQMMAELKIAVSA